MTINLLIADGIIGDKTDPLREGCVIYLTLRMLSQLCQWILKELQVPAVSTATFTELQPWLAAVKITLDGLVTPALWYHMQLKEDKPTVRLLLETLTQLMAIVQRFAGPLETLEPNSELGGTPRFNPALPEDSELQGVKLWVSAHVALDFTMASRRAALSHQEAWRCEALQNVWQKCSHC